MIVYKICFLDTDGKTEVFCRGLLPGKDFETSNINDAYQFRNTWWGDKSNVYIKEIEK